MKIGIPRLGLYSDSFSDLLKRLGCEVVDCPQITKKTAEIGCKHINELMCYPIKVTLGSMVELLDKGAEVLVAFDTEGPCRFKTYHIIQEQILKDMGYDFEMHTIRGRTILKDIKGFTGKSKLRIMRELYNFTKRIKNLDDKLKEELEQGDPKIGVIGEIYTLIENRVNMDLFKKLQSNGAAVYNSLYLSDFIRHHFKNRKDKFEKKTEKYFPVKDFGGHAKYSIANTIKFAEQGIDGVIHIYPFPCSPESAVVEVLDKVGRDYKVPMMHLIFDESSSETNLENRVEAFVEMIRRKK